MVTSEDEITRRLEDKDTVRSARRAEAATMVGDLARRHAELTGQLAELERELGEILAAAGDVIDVPELAQVTDIPAADLTRWQEGAKPARSGKRKRAATKKHATNDKNHPTATTATRQARQPTAPEVTPAAPVDAAGT